MKQGYFFENFSGFYEKIGNGSDLMKFDDDFDNIWNEEEDEEEEEDEVEIVLDSEDGPTFIRPPPTPPVPPADGMKPPRPPKPPKAIAIGISSPRIVGIRGLDTDIYKEIKARAKLLDTNVSDLVNSIFSNYLAEEANGQTISGLEELEISNEDLASLGPSVRFADIDRLIFSPDITSETFTNIKEIKRCSRISVPSHLYLPLLKIAKHCGKIEKYKGQDIPRIIKKEFHSDVNLPREFFKYFLESGQQIDLEVYGEFTVPEDVTLEEWEKVVHSLRVDSEIRVPKELLGWIYAKAETYGDIEIYD